jgi:acylphosphatase
MREEIIRRRLRFLGAVQGVGFRWRARHAAEAVGATGWVQNNPDGSVTMELQGTESQIDRVIQLLDQGRYIQILGMQARSLPVLPEERGFVTKDERW